MLAAALAGGSASSQPFDEDELRTFAYGISAARKDDWHRVRNVGRLLQSELLSDYLRWRELVSGQSEADFDAHLRFMRKHPGWPGHGALQKSAEWAIDETVSFSDRLAFFEERRPLTRRGRIRYAEALLASGDRQRAVGLARFTWRQDTFVNREERYFLHLFGPYLRKEDHEARLDNLLWEHQWIEARQMRRFVDNDRPALAEARIKLQGRFAGVDRALAHVPHNLMDDPGLIFDRMQWRDRKDRDAEVRMMLLDPPDDLGRPEQWWHLRIRHIRAMIDEERFAMAYLLADRHGQTDGLAHAEAQWLAGWLALRFAGRPDAALERFSAMYRKVGQPVSRARAAYWAGRSAAMLDSRHTASLWYQRAADHPTTFYGQLAFAKLGLPLVLAPLKADDIELISSEGTPTSFLPTPERDGLDEDLVRIAEALCLVGRGLDARPFFERLLLDATDRGKVLDLASSCGRPDLVVQLAKLGVSEGLLKRLESFPIVDADGLRNPVEPAVSPALMLAVARQESEFRPVVESSAGAVGMMQIMPSTGRALARNAGFAFDENRLRYDADYGHALAARYLQTLLERYDGSIGLTAAAYNAGPHRVQQWIAQMGDPRTMTLDERIDWIERIPYPETRNYVQRVVEATNVYAQLLATRMGRTVDVVSYTGPIYPAPRPLEKPGFS